MRKFIQKALEKIDKLDRQQISALVSQLAQENDRLEVVLDSMTDGIMVTDTENRLVLYNKAAERLIPFSTLQEVYEKKVWSVIEDMEIADFVHSVLEKQETVRDREFSLRIGGEIRTLSCSVLPLVRNGKIQGNLFHIEDVTEKRSKEVRLRRAESLASLTTLAAGVAHEIKNPLGAIGIHIQLMKKSLQVKGKPSKRVLMKHLEVVNEEVERLNKIVVDFLFAVRPMDANLELRDLNAIIYDLVKFVEVEAAQADVKLNVKLTEGLPKLLLDEKYIKQAVLNLVKNSLSAMPEGGILTLSTDRKGDYVKLQVIDTGIGIPPEYLDKIFEPYFTTKEFGSGLGLTIVYKIVKEHQGEITVDSEPGKGTAVTIKLPVPQPERQLIDYKQEVVEEVFS
ncbi:MAG: ATP-binding protein [Spirochaetales bacterium]